jgi:protein-glutamine gamma-glutamyltransferase
MGKELGQLIFDITLNQRSLIFLLCSIGLITLPHAWHIPLPLFGFFSVLLGWRFAGIWQSQWLPNRLVLFLLTLFGITLLVIQHRGLFGRDAGTTLIVVALGLKLLEIHSKRDVYLIVYLAVIVAASQFLYEQSILMAGYILLVCSVLLATLITQNASQARPLAAIKTSSSIILQALPLTIVIFVLFPRLEAPRWMWLQDDNKALSGLSNTLEPGSISDLSLSEELVFRVRFNGEAPPPKLRYWRGPVYSHTDGVRWTANDKNTQQSAEPIFTGVDYAYTLLMEPQKENWVFALDMAENFDASLRRNGLFQLQTSKRLSERAEYNITSRPFYNTGAISQDEYKTNLQLPVAASKRQLELIKTLHGFDIKPELFIQNLLNHFRQEKFYYTLTPPLMPEDPIDTFLFETRSGFCSHYATAFVYLLRIAKIPARVVGGYQGGEINKVGKFLEVRQADAHAWAEVWLDNKGWVRFDPTAAIAPERIERGVNVDLQIASGAVNFSPLIGDAATLSWLKRSRQLWQSIDYNWQRWVINYNGANQMQFLQSLGIDDIAALTKWLIGSIVLISLPLAWWLLRQKSIATNKAVKYYQRFCTKLAKAGIEKKLGEGARDFAERAKKQRPDLAAQIEQITTLFIRLRYQADTVAGDLQSLKACVGSLRIS